MQKFVDEIVSLEFKSMIEQMKKESLITIILTILIGVSLIAIYWHTKIAQETKDQDELEVLYKYQNKAFHLSNDAESYYFHGVDDLKLQEVVVDLEAFNESQSDYVVTVDEVVEYLGNEFAEDGQPLILSCPENIEKYVSWFWHGGSDIVMEYGDQFNEYLMDNGYPHVYRRMDYQDVVDALEEWKSVKE